MNDCFWCFIDGVCDCIKCGHCSEYISVNSDKGRELYELYELDVYEALIPVSEKWKKKKEQKEKGTERMKRKPIEITYAAHDCMTIGKCPDCYSFVYAGMFSQYEKCKKCGCELDWN